MTYTVSSGMLNCTIPTIPIPETAGQYVTAVKPESTAAFPVSQEIVVVSNPNLTLNPYPLPHTRIIS